MSSPEDVWKHIESFDTIYMKGEDELDRLFEWRDQNKELVRQHPVSMNEGVIRYNDNYYQYFSRVGFLVTVYCFINGKLMLSYVYNILTRHATSTEYNFKVETHTLDEAIQDSLTVYATLMAYMVYNVEYVDSKQHSEIVKVGNKNGRKSKGKGYVSITKKVYSITGFPETEVNDTDKRSYTRQTESWNQRGFWRHYKSGKKSWIDPQVKGAKNVKPTPKTYKL